jgi:hypothetical protein
MENISIFLTWTFEAGKNGIDDIEMTLIRSRIVPETLNCETPIQFMRHLRPLFPIYLEIHFFLLVLHLLVYSLKWLI